MERIHHWPDERVNLMIEQSLTAMASSLDEVVVRLAQLVRRGRAS